MILYMYELLQGFARHDLEITNLSEPEPPLQGSSVPRAEGNRDDGRNDNHGYTDCCTQEHN